MVESMIVLSLLAGVLWLMLKSSLKPSGLGAKFGDGGPVGLGLAFATGVVAMTALVSIFSMGNAPNAIAPTAMAVGVASVLATFKGLRFLVNGFFGAIGALATIPAISGLFTGNSCAPGSANRVLMITMGILLIVVFAISFLVSLGSRASSWSDWVGSIAPLSGLGFYGALELVAFLHTPLGVSLLPTNGLGQWISSLGVTVIVAALASWRPELVLGTAAVAIFIATLGVEGMGLTCDGAPLFPSTIPGLVSFIIAFALAALVFRKLLDGGK